MKKLSIALVILIALIAAWLGAAWYTGTRIEAKAGEAIAHLNDKLTRNQRTMGARIEPVSYERGWLSSHARYVVTNRLLGNTPMWEIDATFSHGPFPLAALQRGLFLPRQFQAHLELLASAGPLKTLVGALMGSKPPLVADIGCSYGSHCAMTGNVPPIDTDLGALIKNAKLVFGGVQIRYDLDYPSDTDYKVNIDAQLLPLSIGGQNFGSGRITVTSDAQSGSGVFSWKTGQGASNFTVALTTTRPVPFWGDVAVTPETLPNLLKTVSVKLELSMPMTVDLVARALNLTQDIDLDTARQQVAAQFDTALAGIPQASQVIQTQGDLVVSNWQYADGKLLINGRENPEMLEQIKQGYLAQLHAQQQDDADAAQAPGGNGNAAASAPQPAASGQ